MHNRVSSVGTVDLVVEHGVEQNAEAELAARTVGLQRQLGLEVHVDGETSEHLSDFAGLFRVANLLYAVATCSSYVVTVSGEPKSLSSKQLSSLLMKQPVNQRATLDFFMVLDSPSLNLSI